MAGQLLGIASHEIDERMPQIEAFAEIGPYIDRPVRLYSSGMQMRLAFSVATAVRPDLLIVDEALSVGDAYFQHKSFNKIREFREQGTSLLIVSHDRSAIQNLCDRAILLENGKIIRDGNPEEVMDYYNAKIAERENSTITTNTLESGKVQIISGTGEAIVEEIYLEDTQGDRIECLDVGQEVTLCIRVAILNPISRLVLGYGIKDRLGQVIFGTNTDLKKQVIHDVVGGIKVFYRISFAANLGPGSYSVQTALCSAETHLLNNYEWRDLALLFEVINVNKAPFAGCAWIDPIIEISKT
ncbi:ABC transporter ATP-binding protein [Diaphorobacter aerolatus]|uniref:ABC transporter ATP-binding protein n=1 Tax=Diaphorobacter aerolatus TaxID=1288495 RepID=UPI00299F7AD4|nr:Wzt carbohydrate-binding domain-containing protein [Diaphorobacter aerolatus]